VAPAGHVRADAGAPVARAEEQLTEQRQVSAVLADLRALVAGLGEQLRGTASSARLESLGGDVASLFTELRMSTAGLGERFEALSRRVDEQAAATHEIAGSAGAGNEALAVRVSALGTDLAAQSTALDRLTDSVNALAAFPDALASIQREVSGLHDRLAPLAEVRTGLADLTARTGAIEALRPEVGRARLPH
jgi:chromosome segregation ATPase